MSITAHQLDGNSIVARTLAVESLTDLPNLIDAALGGQVGDFWDGVKFISPAPVVNRHITVLAFRNRFTKAEKITIDLASIDNPAAAMAQRQQAAAIRVDLADTAAATHIDLDRADTRAGVQALEQGGILGVGRAAIILDSPVLDVERVPA